MDEEFISLWNKVSLFTLEKKFKLTRFDCYATARRLGLKRIHYDKHGTVVKPGDVITITSITGVKYAKCVHVPSEDSFWADVSDGIYFRMFNNGGHLSLPFPWESCEEEIINKPIQLTLF